MKHTPQAWSSEQTTSPNPIIKTIFQEKMKYACNWLKRQNNQKIYYHNFEVGQCTLEFGQRDGKIYYKIQKDMSK